MIEVKIWSDVRCPFCYIGKKNLEDAIGDFEYQNEVSIVWKSFELDPDLETNPALKASDYFVQTKNLNREQAQNMINRAESLGAKSGLDLNIEKSVTANTFNAQRLIKMGVSEKVDNKLVKALFEAQFKNGENIDSEEVLVRIGISAGLEKYRIEDMLRSQLFVKEVREDEREARMIGITGVPHFLFDNTYTISGAQPSETFLKFLREIWSLRTNMTGK